MDQHQSVKEYYSHITKEQAGKMKTNICTCAASSMPEEFKAIAREITPEITERFYGCGSPIPEALEGCTVLDLGCGTGRDCYILSRLVGENGKVIGVDMNDDQLAIAKKHQEEMAKKWGYEKSNITFKKGYIEDLAALGIADASIDVVVSNCVINLAPDKEPVFRETWRVLKEGGELYFADIFCDRRLPESLRTEPVLRGECLGGAMYIEDFRRLMQRVGWLDFRYVTSTVSTIQNPDIEALVGNAKFSSRTIRAFKLPTLIEDICEDYGQIATYQGGIPDHEWGFTLDDHHYFEKGRPHLVCGNSCAMLENTRFKNFFSIQGDRSTHFGAFPGCGSSSEPRPDDSPASCEGGSCCC